MKTTPIETGHKIQISAEWVVELGLAQIAVLEKTAEGILVRPCPSKTWDEIFANKLSIGGQSPDVGLSEVSGDDFLL